VIKGKDIGASLLKIVKAMKAKNTFELIDKVNLHRDNRIEKLMKQKGVSPAMIERIQDECACIIEIAMGCNSVIEIENRIDTLFDENTKGILLSSIHKSKGLEADQVSIFEFSRVRLSHDKMSSDDHIQEKNLDFVARTRAKKILHLVDKKQ
jgi:ATP-dependent exoDNAse (exonuclease V) beta subunit